MVFDLELLRNRLKEPLPGMKAHKEVLSYTRASAEKIRAESVNYREGAVLLLLYEHNDEFYTALIRRSQYEGVHSGQIAFPGGRREPDDLDLSNTALRETHEEIGVLPDHIDLIGELSEIYIPPSQFVVSPFIGYSRTRPNFVADPFEVAEVIEVPVKIFLEDNAITQRKVQVSTGLTLNVDCFIIQNGIVWGATAMILAEFRAVVRSFF